MTTPEVPSNDLDIAIAQTASVPGDIAANVAIACEHARMAAAAGASLIVFPELSLTGYDLGLLGDSTLWLTPGDERLDPLRQLAAAQAITIAVSAPVLVDDARILALVVLGPDGIERIHGKVFPHGPENDVFDPAPLTDRLFEIGGWKIAFAVCFDVAVPAHAAHAKSLGADAYVGSALYVEGEERRVDVHFASRAMDHRMYSVLVNHAGPSSIGASIGGSGVWSPAGDRITQADLTPTLQLARLHADALAPYRT